MDGFYRRQQFAGGNQGQPPAAISSLQPVDDRGQAFFYGINFQASAVGGIQYDQALFIGPLGWLQLEKILLGYLDKVRQTIG